MRTLLRLGVLGAVAATAVVLVRKHDLLTKGAAVANVALQTASTKVEEFFGKAVCVANEALTNLTERDEEPAPFARANGQTTYHMGDVHDAPKADQR